MDHTPTPAGTGDRRRRRFALDLRLFMVLFPLVLIGFAVKRFLDRPPVIDTTDEEAMLREARAQRQIAEMHFRRWRIEQRDDDDDEARRAEHDAALERFHRAKAVLVALFERHSHQDVEIPEMRMADVGYEFLEEEIAEIQSYLDDLVKDARADASDDR